jgi:mRNA interferase RelE/StbE
MPNSTPYRIRVASTAERELRRLPGHVRQRARRMIQDLAREARPGDAKELREKSGFYRLRLDGWRIIYRVDDDNQAVRILRVRLKTGPEVYENLE